MKNRGRERENGVFGVTLHKKGAEKEVENGF